MPDRASADTRRGSKRRILCALLVAALPFGSALADGTTSKNAKTLVSQHELPSGVSLLEVGAGNVRIGGEVFGLQHVADFAGTYAAASAGAAIGAGVGGVTARNDKSVVLHASSLDRGVPLCVGGAGCTVTLVDGEQER